MTADIEYIESCIEDEFLYYLKQCLDSEEEYTKYNIRADVSLFSDEKLHVFITLSYDEEVNTYLYTLIPIECYGDYSSFFKVTALKLLDDYIGSTENPIIEESREIIPILLHNAMCSSSRFR